MKVQPETRVQVSPSVYTRAFGDELVLLDFARGDYFSLDAIGAEIWRKLEAGESVSAVADAIGDAYDVSRDVAMNDIVNLVTYMHEQGLVVVR